MNRHRLLSPNFQELEVWRDFADSIDEVFKDRVDDPLCVLRLLRDTFAYGPVELGAPAPSGAYDVRDLYNFHGENTDFAQFSVVSPQATFTLPANIPTGYPDKNRILVYTRPTIPADSEFTFISPAGYTVTASNSITLNTSVPAGTTVRVALKPHAVEVARKLNQLGFIYNDMDFVTLPTEYENSDAVQVLSDMLGSYYLQSKGAKNFADFFSFCFKAVFRLDQLWSYTTGTDEYPTFVSSESTSIGTPVTQTGGTWYPTSHVNLYYDLLRFGNQLNEKGVRDFFNYIAPSHLVLKEIALDAQIDVGPLYFGASPEVVIHIL